ncbi:MAG: ribonuclease P protein component 4 [Methanoregula sp.]
MSQDPFVHRDYFIWHADSIAQPGAGDEAMKERSKTPATKQIARERIEVLFEQARLAFAEFPDLSNRYVELARRIAMRQRIRIPQDLRRKYCHHCNAYLVPGSNMRVRVHRGNVVVTCLACKKHTRYHMVKPHAGRSE